jgi:hypothetical protein
MLAFYQNTYAISVSQTDNKNKRMKKKWSAKGGVCVCVKGGKPDKNEEGAFISFS